MNSLKFASFFFGAMLAAQFSAGERLIYAVRHNTITEVFSISPENPQPPRAFGVDASPVTLAFMPHSGTDAHSDTTVLGNRMFTPGRERSSGPGAATGIFEFVVDGSASPRKVLDLPAGQRVDLLSIADEGTKLAYLSLSGNGLRLFVHDLGTGKLLHKIDVLKIAGGCIVRNIGWLADSSTLFFTLAGGPDWRDHGDKSTRLPGQDVRHRCARSDSVRPRTQRRCSF